jgi:hypothetical protein
VLFGERVCVKPEKDKNCTYKVRREVFLVSVF